MAFSLTSREAVADGVRRVVLEQIDEAVARVGDRSLDPHLVIHRVRRNCKKIRALIRLVRPRLEAADLFERENRWYADSARLLSLLRDRKAMIEALERLASEAPAPDREPFQAVARTLADSTLSAADTSRHLTDNLSLFRARMLEGRSRVVDWPLSGRGFQVIAPGLKTVYGRGRRAMKAAYAGNNAEDFHEWRKFVKHHLYHLRLLRRTWPEIMRPWQSELEKLAEFLGDDHDLWTVAMALESEPNLVGEAVNGRWVHGQVLTKQAALRVEAGILGRRLFAESPASLTRRLGVYWTATADRRKLRRTRPPVDRHPVASSGTRARSAS